MNAIQLSFQGNNLSFIILTISLCIIGVLYAFYSKYSKELVLSAFSQRYANQYLRDDNVFKRTVNILFNLLIIINLSFVIWSVSPGENYDIIQFLKIIIYTILYYLLKFVSLWFLGHLLKMNQIANIALFFTTLFDKVFALFAFPILVLFHFYVSDITDQTTLIICSFLIFFFVLKIFWILKIGIKSFGLSRFYLFLYICILEFFPLVLLYRGIVFS
ncbi:MAG: hypothetical protein CMD22_04895 [Flavobacteriales bacterium]|nr:hypothetical protein [Flavobacteriales bacterium]|tara:strand:+ start:4727 stop:5377 length:651 start_codon:yes stop_codon:yes gene_type:complete